jgi:hypothetical protein
LENAHLGFFLSRLAVQQTSQEQALFRAQELMRGSTQVVRNWGYPDQVLKFTTEIFSLLDNDFHLLYGVYATRLFETFYKIVEVVEERTNALIQQWQPFMKAKVKKEAVVTYSESFGNVDSSELLSNIVEAIAPNATIMEVKSLLMQHQIFAIIDLFTFTSEDLLELYDRDVDSDSFAAVVNTLTMSFGDLASHNSEHFLLQNPIWRKPIIRVEDNKFFMPLPALFLGFGLDILEMLATSDETLKKKYTDVRSKFLEDKVASYFRSAFPSAKVHQSTHWPRKGEGENDLLVIIDRIAIIVEMKAGSVSAGTRRGAPMSLGDDIESLMVDASRQSSRFQEFLETNPGPLSLPTNGEAVNDVDVRYVKEYLRLSVTLHQLGPLFGRREDLVEAGLIADDEDIAPTITLADLDSIFEVLEGECLKLHYLVRRIDIERNTRYLGSELDLLSTYLDTGFNLGDVEFSKNELSLAESHRKLEDYFMRGESSKRIRKPKPRISKYWFELISELEVRKPFGWSRLGVALLSVPLSDQERFDRYFSSTKRVVRKFWKNEGHNDLCYMETGPSARRLAVVGLAYRNQTPERHFARVQDATAIVLEKVSANRILLIGSNVESGQSRSWDDMVIIERPQEPTESLTSEVPRK